jgi:hypothetical protein
MFSDGRQCTMARSDIHPSLCIYHSDREEQLFGDPGGSFVTRKLDLPELYSACGDLTTAAGVNRALGQVFRLLAQRRISRQEAATFAKLGHLLLQSISAARSSRESHGDQELSRVNKVAVSVAVSSEAPERGAQFASRTPLREIPPEFPPNTNETLGRQSASAVSSPPVPSPAPANGRATGNSLAINTSANPVCNSLKISTYENVELKPLQNQHLQKTDQAACGSKPRHGRQNLAQGATESPACAS